MSKPGRPRAKKERRDMIACVRFTPSEYRYLKLLAKSGHNPALPVSEVVRSLALVGMPVEEPIEGAACPVGTEGATLPSETTGLEAESILAVAPQR